MPKKSSMTPGQRFGRLMVLSEDPKRDSCGNVAWVCRCDCGTTLSIPGISLRTNHTKSCGCLNREKRAQRARNRQTTHGRRHTPEYTAWINMRDRCGNPNNIGFANYGGRGITICPEWSTFEQFYADMGPRPTPTHSIDRIDVNGNYETGNVRWATKTEQGRNQRSNHLLTYGGETKTLTEWAEITGIKRDALGWRLRQGWSLERALTHRAPPRSP